MTSASTPTSTPRIGAPASSEQRRIALAPAHRSVDVRSPTGKRSTRAVETNTAAIPPSAAVDGALGASW